MLQSRMPPDSLHQQVLALVCLARMVAGAVALLELTQRLQLHLRGTHVVPCSITRAGASACAVLCVCRFPAGLKAHDFQGIFGYKVSGVWGAAHVPQSFSPVMAGAARRCWPSPMLHRRQWCSSN